MAGGKIRPKKGGKVMTVRLTGIARRAIPPNRAKEWKPFVAGGVSQRISCAQNHRFRPRAGAAVCRSRRSGAGLSWGPKPPLLDGVPFSPLVLDRDGNLLRLGLSEDEKYRVRIRLNEVAEMVRAVLLYEDRHFYRHPGVNPLSLLRASAGMLGGGTAYGRFHDYHAGGPAPARPYPQPRFPGKFAQMARALQYEYHYGKGNP